MSCLFNNNQVNFFQESTRLSPVARTTFEMNVCVVYCNHKVYIFQESTHSLPLFAFTNSFYLMVQFE